jgi:acetyltransferase
MNATSAAAAEAWTTRDGAPLKIRPIAAADFAIEKAFIAGLSLQTGYRRLLSPRTPQDDEIARFTDIDPAREAAWIAVSRSDGADTMCGVACFVRDGAEAEWAIVLADDCQRRGLGEILLGKLLDSARQAGIEVLSDVTFSTNTGMLALARRLGFTLSRDPRDATLTRMTLRP